MPRIVSIVAEVPENVARDLADAAMVRGITFEAFNGKLLTTVIEEGLVNAVLDDAKG